jgi:hypothetical protein
MQKYSLSDINLLISLFEAAFDAELFAVVFYKVFDENPKLQEYLERGTTDQFLRHYYRQILHLPLADEAIDMIFEKTLEEMPLYINHQTSSIKIAAKWRLTLGR